MALRWIGWACAMGLSSAFPLHTRQTTTSNSHSAKIIAPVVVVSVVCIMLVGFGWWKRRKQTRELLQQLQTPATNTTNNTTNNANSATPSTGADAPARPPRRRRRRRPSQISTKSLPAYNEQAGDEEIVLVRRAQRESESDDEDDENDNDNGRRSTQPSTSHAPDSRPLLDEDSSPDMPRVSLASSSRGRSPNDHPDPQSPEQSQLGHESIANATTIASSIADTELEPEPSPAAPHPHEVPSYTEAMSTSHVNLPTTTETDHSAQPSTSTATEIDPPVPADADGTVRPKRKSVFRHLGRFHISKPSGSSTPAPEAVEMSTTSPRASTSSNRPSGSTHRSSTSLSTNTHKPSPSLSSLSLILTRSQSPTMSRTSLNISAPISTTLVRTELNYPRAGPTPEQIRFLSSRESLGRFGMPYGEQAIAAAKSRDHLPPVYKPREGETPGASGSGSGAGANGSEAGNPTVQEDEPTVTIRRGPMFLTPGELAQRKTSETPVSGPAETERDRADSDPILDPAMTIQEEPIAVEEAIQEDSKSIQEEPMTAVNGDGQESRGQVESRRRVSPLEFNDARRESVMTTNSFVTATEGQGDSSPPTPTAETYQTQVPTLSHGLGTQDQSPNSVEQQSNGSEQQAHVPGGAQFQAPGGTTVSAQSPIPTRAQTVLIPESRDALHPELTLVPATPIGEP